jgi:hypothetical protein
MSKGSRCISFRASSRPSDLRGPRSRRPGPAAPAASCSRCAMFVAAELRDWLLDAGFTSVNLLDPNGDPLTVQSRRMISIATGSGHRSTQCERPRGAQAR